MRHRLFPWALGLVVASALCSTYVMSFAFRKVWQSHYPELVAKSWTNNGSFTVLAVYGSELGLDEMIYAARTNEASRRLRTFDPYIKENRSFRLFTIDTVTFFLMGRAAAVLGVNWAWVFIRFVCAAAWCILVYLILMEMTDSPAIAAFGGAFVTGFGYLLMVNFVQHLNGSPMHDLWIMLSYGRTESVIRLPRPGVTYAFAFLACLPIARAARETGWTWAIASGFMGGLLAYVRLDIWTTYVVGAYIFAAAWWLKHGFKKELWVSAVLTSVLSLPFLYFNYPPIHEQMLRIGVEFKREFHPYSLVFLGAFLAVLKYKTKPMDLFLGSFLGGVFIMVNIELLTGYDMSSVHWIWFGQIFLFLVLLSFLPPKAGKTAWPWLSGAGLAVALLALQSIGYAAVHFPFQGNPKDYDDAMAWLKAHAPDDSVVASLNPEINHMLPVFTRNKVLMSNIIPNISNITMIESTRRLLTALDILGADRDRYVEECLQGLRKGPGHVARRDISGSGVARGELEKGDIYATHFFQIPHDMALDLINQAAGDFKKERFEVDYVWFGHLEKEFAAPGFPKKSPLPLKEVYRNPMVTLYQVQPQNILK